MTKTISKVKDSQIENGINLSQRWSLVKLTMVLIWKRLRGFSVFKTHFKIKLWATPKLWNITPLTLYCVI